MTSSGLDQHSPQGPKRPESNDRWRRPDVFDDDTQPRLDNKLDIPPSP
jgi:hypothetical protein